MNLQHLSLKLWKILPPNLHISSMPVYFLPLFFFLRCKESDYRFLKNAYTMTERICVFLSFCSWQAELRGSPGNLGKIPRSVREKGENITLNSG